MSSAGANRESEGGTMKNVVNNPETKPESHKYAEEQSNTTTNTNTQKANNQSNLSGAGANQESEGGTMKNVIDNPETKTQSPKHAEGHSNTQTKN